MATAKKKRTQKYNPQKVGNVYRARSQQIHTLEMSFQVDSVNENMAAWHEHNADQNLDYAPKSIAYDSYEGDLIICLKNLLIPDEQEWFLSVVSYAYGEENGDILEIPTEIKMPLMSFEEFRFGGATKIDRGHGLKTRWKGATAEINAIIESKTPPGYLYARTDAYLRVDTAFKNVESFLYFRKARNLRALGQAI